MKLDNKKIAGILLFIGVAQFVLMLIILEAVYPGYNAGTNYVSDLGVGPTGFGFSSSIIILGVAIISASYFLYKAFKSKAFLALLIIMSIGAIGVGLFPETTGTTHYFFALVAFGVGAVGVMYSSRFQRLPLKYISVLLGVFSLAALLIGIFVSNLGLGVGGIERMVLYPILIWGLAFSGYLMV